MMRFLLLLVICVIAFNDISGISLGLGAGLSAKNLLVYLGGGWLLLLRAMGTSTTVELRTLRISFMVLIGYAVLTMFIASGVIHYEGYDLRDSAYALKSLWIDPFVFFLVFFYGTRTIEDARWLIKALLFLVSIANLFTIAKATGIIEFGADIMAGAQDADVARVHGVFGDANETGTMITTLLPAYIVFVLAAKGFARLFWVACMTSSAVVLLMGASRGALVSLILGALWAAYLCRAYISFGAAIKWGSAVFAIMLLVALVAGHSYLESYFHRFTDVYLSSAGDVSAGRTDIWTRAILRMMNSPLSLITGFGWNTWLEGSVMGFYIVAHNHYLSLWFELGLVGLICFIVMLRQVVKEALTTIAIADAADRDLVVAFVFSFLILAVGIFFVLLYKPWLYIWPYIGLAMRYTINVRAASRAKVEVQPATNLVATVEPFNAPARFAGKK